MRLKLNNIKYAFVCGFIMFFCASTGFGADVNIPRVHVARGLWWDMLGIHGALALMGGALPDCSYDVFGSPDGYHGCGAPLGDFPNNKSEFDKYDLIVIANCSAGSLSRERRQLLLDWIQQGGGLLVTGGVMAFGQGDYHGTLLEEVLPVTVLDGKDMVQTEQGGSISVTEQGGEFGLDFSGLENMTVFFYHSGMKLKPEADVLLEVEDAPLLVVRELGKGRVAVFSGTVCGVAPEGIVAFWDSDAWPEILARTMAWLAGKPERKREIMAEASRAAEYSSFLRELKALAEPDFDAILAGIDEPDGQVSGKSGRYDDIYKLAGHCADTPFALAVVEAVTESDTPLTSAQAGRLFDRIASYVEGQAFEEPALKLAGSIQPGRIAFGMRVLGKISSKSLGEYAARYLASGLGGIPKEESAQMSGMMAPPDGEGEHLRLAAVRAVIDSADPDFLDGFKKAADQWRAGRSSGGLSAALNDDIGHDVVIATALMGDGEAALQMLETLVNMREEMHEITNFLEQRTYGFAPDIEEQKKDSRIRLGYLKKRRQRSEAALVRLPESVIPAFLTKDPDWRGEFAVEYLLAFAFDERVRAKVLELTKKNKR